MFDSIRISVFCDVTKIEKKSSILRMSRTLILHKLLTKQQKKVKSKWINRKIYFIFSFKMNCPTMIFLSYQKLRISDTFL